MGVDRSAIVEETLLSFLNRWVPGTEPTRHLNDPIVEGSPLSGRVALRLMESQMISRLLDYEARRLKKQDKGYYTIGSAGHEGNVVLGALVKSGDPSFLHYRSGALMIERARQVSGTSPIFDTLLGMVASKDDPISGGRHKVFGSKDLWVPPQTSTIASHLPKALGCAFALDRAHSRGIPVSAGRDAIVMCTFGDASVNHSTAQGTLNAASWTAFQNLPLPLLFVCEDNHIGISVRTPENWIRARCSTIPHIPYFHANGLDLVDAYRTAKLAVEFVRSRRRPAFLHMEVVRLLGHAGSDVESEYLLRNEIEANEAEDPLLRTASLVLRAGLITAPKLQAMYLRLRDRVQAAGDEVARCEQLSSAAEVMEPIYASRPDVVHARASQPPDREARIRLFGGVDRLPETSTRPRHMAVQLNRALTDALAGYPELMIFGEDVGRKGGVYHVTTELTRRAGIARVFNTLLDETNILGLAIGAAHIGVLPVPEIQYLAYYHNAEDQLRSEACSLQFFSKGQFSNPMVVRIASFAYQRGFGGHFHNDNSIAALRDLPGLIIAAPTTPDDAVRQLRTCLAAARVDGKVVVFLEPIALYMTKDLLEPGDGLWQTLYPPLEEVVEIGRGTVHHTDAQDLTIVSYANGTYLSLRAAHQLREHHGIGSRVVDLRWLAPIDKDLVVEHVAATSRVLFVDEGRKSAGIHETLTSLLVESMGDSMPQVGKVVGEDTYIPLGPAADTVLPTSERIVAEALRMLGRET